MASLGKFPSYGIPSVSRVTPLITLALSVSSSTNGKSAVSQDLHMACSSSLTSNRITKWLTYKNWLEGTWKYSQQMHRHVLQFGRSQKSWCGAVLSSCDSHLIQWHLLHIGKLELCHKNFLPYISFLLNNFQGLFNIPTILGTIFINSF